MEQSAEAGQLVPSESLDRDNHVMLGTCLAGQPAVWGRAGVDPVRLPLAQAERHCSDRAPPSVVEIGLTSSEVNDIRCSFTASLTGSLMISKNAFGSLAGGSLS